MSDEKEKGGIITDAAKAIAAVTENLPIYQDAIQPAAKEIGKSLQVVAQAVNAALMPVEGLVWGVERIRDFVREKVATKLEAVPPEDIQQPKPHIAVPAIDALRYTGAESELSELYANLLATSMDRVTVYQAHPAFVDIIKNMVPDEARIMRFLASNVSYPLINIKLVDPNDSSFHITHRHISLLGLDAQCDHPTLTPSYLDNLERLGLIHIPALLRLANDELYKRIEEFPQTKSILETLREIEGKTVELEKIKLEVTDFGKQFMHACVLDKRLQARG